MNDLLLEIAEAVAPLCIYIQCTYSALILLLIYVMMKHSPHSGAMNFILPLKSAEQKKGWINKACICTSWLEGTGSVIAGVRSMSDVGFGAIFLL